MLGPALANVAVGLFILFAVSMASQLLPPRLLVSAWQLRAASALIETGPFALIGLVLLQLGAHLDPANQPLQQRWHRLGRLGVLAVLGFLLLMPLQLVAFGLSLQAATNAQLRLEQRLDGNLELLRRQIQAASSFPDLQRRIRDIQAPDLVVPAEALRLPLPQLRRRLLASVDQMQARVRRNLSKAREPERTYNVVRSLVRGVISSLVLALCFAAATPLWNNPGVSVLQHWHWTLMGLRLWRGERGQSQRLHARDAMLRTLGYDEEQPQSADPDLQSPTPSPGSGPPRS